MDAPAVIAAPPSKPQPQASPSNDEPTPPEPGEKLVPVAEAIRYRKRAQQAEQQLEALRGQLDELDTNLKASEETITALERRQRIDALLAEADAVDLDAARLLTEAAVTQMDDADVATAVEDLRRHKPYLFRQTRRSAAAMGPSDPEDPAVDDAAQCAATTGHRRDLLRYLRLRRGT